MSGIFIHCAFLSDREVLHEAAAERQPSFESVSDFIGRRTGIRSEGQRQKSAVVFA